MVDLRAKPFYLNDEQIRWVEETIAGMTLEEKIGQLFVLLKGKPGVDEKQVCGDLARSHQGGLRWQGGDKEQVYEQNRLYQKHSKIPLFIAANCDEGGNGCLPEGTFVATAAQAGAGGTPETSYHMGLVAGREASAVGCNWMFNPVCDIYKNWRNTIVNTRSFGESAEAVIPHVRAYIRGIKEANPYMACCGKHFPGDGMEELDQHLALGLNELSVQEWHDSYGKVYRTMIDEGLESVMVGHFAMPAMSRALRPGIRDEEIMPATLAPEIMTDLLRGELGFNGLIITDASHMIGFAAMARRCDAVPGAIAAGADMFLFAGDVEEDMAYMRAGYESGVISPERLSDALHRIIGMKAHLHLYEEAVRVPSPQDKERWVGCDEHRAYTAQAADACVTLVKDTAHLLPLGEDKRRAYLVFVQSTPTTKGYRGDPAKKIFIEELERAGFSVAVCPNYHDLEVENGVSPMNFVRMLDKGSCEEFRKKYDVVFLVLNIKGYAQENNVRVRWSCNHSCELPWYIHEVPTVGISLNFTNHLIDVPQLKTFVNAYSPARENIRAAIEKVCGKSAFKGTAGKTAFCGRWETRL